MYKCTYVLKDSKKKRGTRSFKCQVKSLKAITLCSRCLRSTSNGKKNFYFSGIWMAIISFAMENGHSWSSLRDRRLKGKGKGVLGARETQGAREEGDREPARRPLLFSFLTSTRRMLKS